MKKRVLYYLILFIMIVTAYVFFTKDMEMDVQALNDLKSAIEVNNTLEMNEIAVFTWDELYILTPYTDPTRFFKQMGINNFDDMKTSIYSSDAINLLVFTLDKKVVRFVEFPRQYGDFSNVTSTKYSPDEAIFDVSVVMGRKRLLNRQMIEAK